MMCRARNWNIPSFIGWGEWSHTSGGHKHWRIQPSVLRGATWRRGPSQGTPKIENYADLDHFFWAEPKFTFEKKMSDLTPAREVPQIIENLTEVDIRDVEKTVRF